MAYSSAIFALPHQELPCMSVSTFCTLNAMRSCRCPCRFSPTGSSVRHGYAMLLQQRARPDSGELQDLRASDRACGEQGLAPGRGENFLPAVEVLHAQHAPAISRSLFTWAPVTR